MKFENEIEKSKFIEDDMKLVYHTINKYFRNLIQISPIDCSFEDLVSIGNIGLIKAVDTFDETKGFAFSTYATFVIKSTIHNEFRICRHGIHYGQKILLAKDRITKMVKNNKTYDEIAKELNLTEKKVEQLYHIDTVVCSLDNEGLNFKLSNNDYNFENNTVNNILIKCIFEILNQKEKQIIYDYYFKEKNQTQIGKELGISQEQVSRTISKILNNVRKELKLCN